MAKNENRTVFIDFFSFRSFDIILCEANNSYLILSLLILSYVPFSNECRSISCEIQSECSQEKTLSKLKAPRKITRILFKWFKITKDLPLILHYITPYHRTDRLILILLILLADLFYKQSLN